MVGESDYFRHVTSGIYRLTLCKELGWWKGYRFPASLPELVSAPLEVTTLLSLTSAKGVHPAITVAVTSGEASQGACKSSSADSC